MRKFLRELHHRDVHRSAARAMELQMEQLDKPPTPRPLCGEWPRPLALLLVLGIWMAFGCGLGYHWLVIFFVAARTPAERRACIWHFSLQLSMAFVTAAGGGWCRGPTSTYLRCERNASMTRRCLWEVQPLDYQVIYVAHFVSGGALLCMGVLDVAQMPAWTLSSTPLTTLYSRYRLFPTYTLVLAAATTVVTITWTALVDWSTDDGSLNRLGAILFVEIVIMGALAAAALRWAAPRCCTPALA